MNESNLDNVGKSSVFEPVGSRTSMADSCLLGIPRTTGVFLLEAERPALIETSAAAVAPRIISALRDAGVDDLAYIIVSHIHLDHAGATGQIAEAFPNATVIVHEQGARHLEDPSRLEASAARVYGEDALIRHWGHLMPIASDRMRVVTDGDVVDLGDRTLDVIYAPGHAKHQIALADSETGGVFLGDSAGIYLADYDYQTPSAPPPDLNPELAVASLKRIAERHPEVVYFTHYGPGHEPDRLLTRASEQYIRWGEIVRESLSVSDEVGVIADELATRADPDRQSLPADIQENLNRFSPYETAAAGYLRHFEHLGMTQRAAGDRASSSPGDLPINE